ncbi:diguanylate cyclase [Rhizobacter sp. OV335]|uniref:sensor domain-containing diguanylate cyclase n=1 Tax=Rhizobacter sp. OV335 TaxID=1500264 RepID=UPI00092418F7|nr:diguanylate cyclase [Rhizobacter sp. OV335]SHN34934.1 diguanylate cyclase [Rhizobacter sp. OV335]
MDTKPQAPQTPAVLAKAALRRLVVDKLEPTPENYARAYQLESGIQPSSPRAQAAAAPPSSTDNAAQAAALAGLIERIARGTERGGRNWTAARKKESLQRVLSSSRSDVQRLQQRLGQLVGSWESDTLDDMVEADDSLTQPAPLDALPLPAASSASASVSTSAPAIDTAGSDPAFPLWRRVAEGLSGTVQLALPPPPAPSADLSRQLTELLARLEEPGPVPLQADEFDALCDRARRMLQHRHHFVDQLGGLCQELTASLAELAEDDSWARGQVDAMKLQIDGGLTARSVRSVSELLGHTRERQQQLREDRARARDALKLLINRMLSELGELGQHTGRFHESVGRYADTIEKADSLESLAGVVREMVEESRTVQSLVSQAQGRLESEHAKAVGLSERVAELEGELRRLSEEVSTDQLTQIANRRGLMQAFDAERARMERGQTELSIGLLDVDNFKRLNDELGHAAGDTALKSLAEVVSKALRPTDLVARYGGEEFVVLLPDTPVQEGEQILTRLQRSLSGGLFMHEERQVFVTFSAGVTLYRQGEPIEAALERADEALYEAKRTGKNRTCVG